MEISLRERLEAALVRNPDLSKAGLARACDVRQPSVSDWFNGRTKRLTGENLLNAAAYLGVSDTWLATGKGEMTANRRAQHPPSQPERPDDANMAQGLELLYLMADARPEDKRFQRPSWVMIQVAAKIVSKADISPRDAMAEILEAMKEM
jgi:transcriptional regulator with XRE-family HTH domain